MKRCMFLLAVTLNFLFSACKKDGQVVVNGLSAKKGAIAWNTANVNTGFKPLATKDTLFINVQNGEENLVLAIKQRGAATYQPGEFKAYYYTTIGFDVVGSKYHLLNDPNNIITISKYDETTHDIEATFNLNFINNDVSIADKITFTNGNINTRLSDVFMDPYK